MKKRPCAHMTNLSLETNANAPKHVGAHTPTPSEAFERVAGIFMIEFPD